MTDEDYFQFLSLGVFGNVLPLWNSYDETSKGELCMRLATEGVMYWACNLIGDNFFSLFHDCKDSYHDSVLHAEELHDKLNVFIQELEQNKIRFALFKGADLAYRVYPDPVCRPYFDWDILFHPDDMTNALDFLSKTGWMPSQAVGDNPRIHHFPCHKREGVAMEPHLYFLNLEHEDYSDVWDEMRLFEGIHYHYILSPELYLIVLCRHTSASGYGHVSLTKFLLDVGYLLKTEPQIDWGHVRELCKRWDVPYAGNMLAAWPDFFPAGMVAAMDPDPNAAKAFRKIFEEREKLHGIDQHVWVMNYNQENGEKSWIAHQMELLRPKQVRAVYGMHAQGQYPALAWNYLRYCTHRAGLLLKNFWRYDSRLRKFDKLVKEAESYR